MTIPGVWIVQHDETPHNTVLGVFDAQEEAASYAEEVGPLHKNGVIYAFFPLGYRFYRDALANEIMRDGPAGMPEG